MALLLYRIGHFSYRRHWQVLSAWLVLLAAALTLGLAFGGQMEENFEIPGTESQNALDRLEQVFPQVAGESAQVVVAASDSIDNYRDELNDVAQQIEEVPRVEQALDPYSEYATGTLSEDGKAAIIQVQFESVSKDQLEEPADQVREVADQLKDHGLKVEYGGMLYQNLEYGLTATELVGVAFAALVLFVTFGSVAAAGMPLAAAITSVGVTMGVLLFITRFVIVSSATPMLAVMIGLAVGIDYALFIISRHRKQLASGMEASESAALATGTSGSAVVFAGATVMVALFGLTIVGIPFLSVMGIAAAAGVFMAMLVSLTLVPALLGIAGERLRPREGSRAWKRETGQNKRPTMGRRWVRIVMRAPILFVLLVIGLLTVAALPALHMQTSLPSGKGEAEGNTARDAYDIVTEHFGEGTNGPLLVMLDITQMDNDTLLDDLEKIRDEVAAVDGVELAGDALPNPTVDSAIIQVIPTTGPDDPATMDTVQRLRDLAPQIEDNYNAVSSVTGMTAVQIDITDRLNGALLPFAGVVVGISVVLLTMVFRSLLVPIKAAVSFLLSAFAAFGLTVLVFQDGVVGEILGIVPGPIIAFLPVLLLAIVFGLAMDYEVFLVSGMRESYVHGHTAREAIEEGFAGAARVVTAAALIMFFVFAAFVPEGAGVIKVIAFGLAVGIFFDAFLVRMTLVPALMTLFGDRAWTLPKWLERKLPNLDIEGEQLREHLDAARWAAEHSSGIAFDQLQLRAGKRGTEPLDVELPAGGILLASGDPLDRKLLADTIAGRLEQGSGSGHVLGRSLPGDSPALVSRVTRVDLGNLDDRSRDLDLGQLLARHGAFATRMFRSEAPAVATNAALQRANEVLAELGETLRLDRSSRLELLEPLPRAVAQLSITLAEQPEVLVVDLGQLGSASTQSLIADIVRAIDLLAVNQRSGQLVTVVVCGSHLNLHSTQTALARSTHQRESRELALIGKELR